MALIPFAVYFFVYWMIGLFPNWKMNSVDMKEAYDTELQFFGMEDGGTRVIPGQYFMEHSHPALDLIAGLSYLCWLPVPIGFSVWLAVKGRTRDAVEFGSAFLLVNIFGFAVYYAHPEAAPWYVLEFGFVPDFSIPGSEAGLARFDRLTNIPFYHAFYGKNANVFAAMPSLHSAYPLVTTIYAFRYGMSKKTRALFCLMTLGIWFCAIYSAHHYTLDVIAGIAVVIVGIFTFDLVHDINDRSRNAEVCRNCVFYKWKSKNDCRKNGPDGVCNKYLSIVSLKSSLAIFFAIMIICIASVMFFWGRLNT